RDGHVTGVQTCALPILSNHFNFTCSSKFSPGASRHIGSSGRLIAKWKASRMTRGECRATLFSLPSAVRKAMAINLSIKRSSRERSEERRVGKEGRAGGG